MKTARVILFICCTLGFSGCLEAIGGSATGHSTAKSADGVVTFYGILCGISTFKDSSMDLDYPAKDAQDLRAALLKSYNWKDANITLLLNRNATQQSIHNAILEVAQKADADDVVLFYYSGHGSKVVDVAPLDELDGEDETLIDFEGNDILDDTLSDWFKGLPTSKYVVFIDTCYSGGQVKCLLPGLGSAGSFSDAHDGFGADFFVSRVQTDLDDLKHGVVVTACDSDELATETSDFKNGVFTHFLLQSLSLVGDRNQNNWVSAEECYQYVSSQVTDVLSDQHVQIYDSNTQSELEFYEVAETGGNSGGDTAEALKVTATIPEGNASAVDSSLAEVDIKFNKTFEPGANFSLISIKDSSGRSVPQIATISDIVLHISLHEALVSSGTYTVTVPAAAVVDAKGKGLGGDYVFSFTLGSLSDKAAGANISGGGCSEIGWPVIALIFLIGWSGVGVEFRRVSV